MTFFLESLRSGKIYLSVTMQPKSLFWINQPFKIYIHIYAEIIKYSVKLPTVRWLLLFSLLSFLPCS